MLASLLIPGDERNQIIVWKVSSFAFLALIGSNLLNVAENLIRSQYTPVNPLTQLEVTAIIYFAALMYYKKRHGG